MKFRTTPFIPAFLATAWFAAAAPGAKPDIVLGDFEQETYGKWKAYGEAFGSSPAGSALPGQMPVSGFAGKGLANSFGGGDKTTGILTSPEFTINRGFLSFLVGGGGHKERTCVNLLVDGSIVRSATGPNTAPGGSEALAEEVFDLREFAGKGGTIQIVDGETGGWGHINADHFVLTDKPANTVNALREFLCDRQYLNLPVKNGARKRRMGLKVEGKLAAEFEIELADAEPDFWTFLDLTRFGGRRATITVDRLPADSTALSSIEVSETIKGAENLYREPLRPQFHFSSRRGWLNDPNGLVWHAGEYHLYYQHNPYGWNWGNMHWGHAVSADLVRWRELPVAIYPRRFDDWAFSGSAVVDPENTSGWKQGGEAVLVGAYTSTGRGECMIFSHDRGRTWTEFESNPVVRHEGRDPRLLWHKETRQWVMALYDEAEKKQWITFYTSPDCRKWSYQSRIEGFFECPDLFELPVDGDSRTTRWVLTAANSEYMIGSFDGKEFKPETPKLPGHRGEGFYAAQTFTNEPKGRVVQIGWGQFESPGMPFNQMMCFPTELSLRTTDEGLRLYWQPVAEIETLRAKSHRMERGALKQAENALAGVGGELVEIRAEIHPGSAAGFTFEVNGVRLQYDAVKQELVTKTFRVPMKRAGNTVSFIILADRTSLEVFGNGGAVYVPLRVPHDARVHPLSLSANGGDAEIVSLEVHELRSIWNR